MVCISDSQLVGPGFTLRLVSFVCTFFTSLRCQKGTRLKKMKDKWFALELGLGSSLLICFPGSNVCSDLNRSVKVVVNCKSL